jgi:hypothetical protein
MFARMNTDPHKFVGYLHPEFPSPTFIIPVFKNLETDETFFQAVSDNNQISYFRPTNRPIVNFAGPDSLIRVGEEALYGVISHKKGVFLATYNDFMDHLRLLMTEDEFAQHPAFGLSVAKMLKDSQKAEQFTKAIFHGTFKRSEESRKFFLENNIVRDNLIENIDPVFRDIVRKMRIDIVGQKISVDLPKETPEALRKDIGQRVSNRVKEYTKSDQVELSFDDFDTTLEIRRKITEIRNGYFNIDARTVDAASSIPLLYNRDANVLIPEAAQQYYSLRHAKSVISRKYLPEITFTKPLSQPTVNKILGLNPVSMSSAMLFRIWKFGDPSRWNLSSDLRLHVCLFRLGDLQINKINGSSQARECLASGRSVVDRFTFPISFLMFFVDRGILSHADLRELQITPYAIFSPEIFTWKFRREWIDYAVTDFTNIRQSTVDSLFQQLVLSS